MKNTEHDSFTEPLSALERQTLMPICAELGINPNAYSTNRALCQAITEAGFYEI